MFEALQGRAEALVRRRAREAGAELAARLGAAGIEAEADEAGVRLRGRGLVRRFALEPALRWLRQEWRR